MSFSNSGVIQGSFRSGGVQLLQRQIARQKKASATSRAVPCSTAPLQARSTRQVIALASVPSASVRGQPLPPAIQRQMESFFKTDFSGVRVHIGPHVASINALAYTQGSNLHFAPGQYDPYSAQGQELLGHELTHVIQQRSGRVRSPLSQGVAVIHDDLLEAEADRQGKKVAQLAALRPAPVQRKSAAGMGGRSKMLPNARNCVQPMFSRVASSVMRPAATFVYRSFSTGPSTPSTSNYSQFQNLRDVYATRPGASMTGPLNRGRQELENACRQNPSAFSSAVQQVNRKLGINTAAELPDWKKEAYIQDVAKVARGELNSAQAFGRSAEGWMEAGNYPAAAMNRLGQLGSKVFSEGAMEDFLALLL